MKIFAAILVGLMLPFTFATSANAAHLDAEIKSISCKDNGDTAVTVKVYNRTSRFRKMNWSVSKTSKGYTYGLDTINKQGTFRFVIPAGESATVWVWTRLNQKTQILKKTILSTVCE